MFTGRQALGSIETALQRARRQLAEAEQRVEATSRRLMELEREELAHFRSLAQIRVDLLAAGEIIAQLDRSERTVVEIIEQRDQARHGLQQEITASAQRSTELEGRRAEQLQRVDAAEALLERRESRVQQRLRDDPDYQRQLAAAQEADRIARHAEEKTALAEQDRAEKGKPYLLDPLFSYLWRRGYGTSAYHASAPIRYLDGWVARLCRYGDARANYAMLTEIPLRLKEHSDSARDAAERALDALESLELQAAEADGLALVRASLDDARALLERVDDELEAARQEQQALLRQQSEFAAGEDRYYRQAIAYLAEELVTEAVSALHDDARSTPTPEDDVVVRRLRSSRLERDDLAAQLERQRELVSAHRKRSEELETLSLEFKRRRYDGQSSVFADDSLVSTMLSEFLRGVLSRDGLWREIERQHRYHETRPAPDFGSGGFTRRKSGRGGGGSWGGFGGGRGGGGGGFRTGGGF